ncbi:MAG TPA: ATP-binding protein [Stellaceae bacterium]|nr:ATP-binding protein [Stellaceae bacterium]
MSDTPQLLLAHHLKALKLPTFLREYDKLAQQCAAEGVDHPRYLLRLAELELIERERRMVERRIKEARFPTVKSLDSFDFTAIPSLNKTLVLELARCEYMARRENVIAVGNSGTGKTHIALGLGLAACQKGLAVGFITAAALVHELIEARDEKRLLRLAELELIDREQRMVERRIKEARFPTVKSLDSFEFAAIPSLNKTLVLELARCEYVARRENVIAVGNSGTGKTHIALGLGLAACQKGLSVGFVTAAALVHELIEARDEKRLLRLQRQLAGYKLLIIDELGYVPLSTTGAELLFEVFSQRYERGSKLKVMLPNR